MRNSHRKKDYIHFPNHLSWIHMKIIHLHGAVCCFGEQEKKVIIIIIKPKTYLKGVKSWVSLGSFGHVKMKTFIIPTLRKLNN